jgi:exopolyphosphatase/guanosine-5'-triphosphate,3'-diphosphate pyrophosphatase
MQGKNTAAVIDVGSNTIKILCAQNCDRTIENIAVRSIDARLGGEIRGGQPWLTKERRKTAVEAISDLLAFSRNYHPDTILVVATSAVRDAVNQDAFQQEVETVTGQKLRILREGEEAMFIGRGISCDPDLPNRKSFCAIDLGGGSMECINYHNGCVEQGISLPLGAVRLTRNFTTGGSNPITDHEEQAIHEHVIEHLETASLINFKNELLVGCGGAFSVTRAVFANRTGLSYRQTSPILNVSLLRNFYEEIRQLPLVERCQISHLPDGQADILPVALVVLMTVAEYFKCRHFHHSNYNLRFGLAATLLGHFPDKT